MAYTTRNNGFRGLRVWQVGVELAVEVCLFARELPREERFALGDQMRRAAIGIPSAIAEGYSKPHAPGSTAEYKRYLGIAQGSSGELETQVEIALRLGADGERAERVSQLMGSTGRMLRKLHRSL